jgi:hypothetical protein
MKKLIRYVGSWRADVTSSGEPIHGEKQEYVIEGEPVLVPISDGTDGYTSIIALFEVKEIGY